MSWSIWVTGTKQGVKRKVREAKAYGDESQLEIAKKFIVEEIDAYPEAVTGVEVKASGHHDISSRNLSIEVKPVYLALDEGEPNPAQ
jgi:hypothetical protein